MTTEPPSETPIPQEWNAFIQSGNYGPENRKSSLRKGYRNEGGQHVFRGVYSGIKLEPDLLPGHPLYPSHDHIDCDRNDSEMVIETVLINRMKTNLTAEQFWRVVGHLFAEGVAKGIYRENFRPDQQTLAALNALKISDVNWSSIADVITTREKKPARDFIRTLKCAFCTFAGGVKFKIDEAGLKKAVDAALASYDNTRSDTLVRYFTKVPNAMSVTEIENWIDERRDEICELAGVSSEHGNAVKQVVEPKKPAGSH